MIAHDPAEYLIDKPIDAVAGVCGNTPVHVEGNGDEQVWTVRYTGSLAPRLATLTVRCGRVVAFTSRPVAKGGKRKWKELVAGVA